MTVPADPAPGALRRELQRLPEAQRRAVLLHELSTRAARLLLLPSADAVQPSSAWLELGFDSLRAVDFRCELETVLALPLRSTLLHEHRELDSLVDHLLTRLQSDVAPRVTGQEPAPEVSARRDVVLCVGDSCTGGAGSSDPMNHSYPAVLQTLLRERAKRDWVVVNGAWAGQDSRDVLHRLPAQLAEFRPRVVCVQVGFNDFWSCPEVLPDDEQGEYGPAARAAPVARGPEWAPRNVRFESPHHRLPQKWQSTQESLAHKLEGWRLAAASDAREALAEFELAFAAVADDAQTRQMLVSLYLRTGRREMAAPHLHWLIDSWARDRDFWIGSSLAAAFEECGRAQDAREVAVQVLACHPEDGATWRCRAVAEFHLGLHAAASQSIAEAIRLLPDRRSWFWRHRIHLFGLRDVDEGIRTIFNAYVVLNDADAATKDLRDVAMSVDGVRLRSVLASFACEPDVHGRLAAILEDVLASKDGTAVTQVLQEHLRRIATTVRNAGATPVFVSYHFEHRSEAVMRTIATEHDVVFVGTSQGFAQRLAARRREDILAPDGHCNDEGYRLMAAIVADGVQDIVAAPSS